MVKVLKILSVVVAIFLVLGLLYIGMAVLSALFPQTGRVQNLTPVDLPFYVCGDQVHTDLVISTHDPAFKGGELFGQEVEQSFETEDYYYIGWGDYVFFTQLAQVSDATPAMIFSALRGENPSAIRLRSSENPTANVDCYKLRIDAEAKAKLFNYIKTYLQKPLKPVVWPSQDHHQSSVFYFFTIQHYSPLSTCNQWVADALDAAGAPHASFSPFAFGVVWPLEASNERASLNQ